MGKVGIPRKRIVSPFLQGDLDGLCGLYAIINALRALCPEIDAQTSEKLFARTLKSLERRHGASLLSTVEGLGSGQIMHLVNELTSHLARREAIFVRTTRRRLMLDRRSLPAFWQALRHALDQQSVMIFYLGGRCQHWTVLFEVRRKSLRLIDSSGAQTTIKRSSCSLNESKTKFRLHTSNLITLTRTGDDDA